MIQSKLLQPMEGQQANHFILVKVVAVMIQIVMKALNVSKELMEKQFQVYQLVKTFHQRIIYVIILVKVLTQEMKIV